MTNESRQKRVEKIQTRILFQVPFFAAGVCKLGVEFLEDAECPALFGADRAGWTACTDGERVKWCGSWFDKLTDQKCCTVLVHEAAHCLLGHLWRVPDNADWDVWNQATDHAVNNMLKGCSQSVMAKRVADPFPFPDGRFCCDPKFAGMAEEVVYSLLANKPEQQPKEQPKPQAQTENKPGSAKGQGGPGQKQGHGDPAPAPSPGRGKQSFGEIVKPSGSAAQNKQKQTEWQSTLIQSVKAAKGRGDIPGEFQRMVDSLVHPLVPWWELLRSLIREQAYDDWNWMKPNRYSEEFILPSLHSERMSAVYFGIDTSGSIDAETLRRFKSEAQYVLDDMQPAKLVELCCDARVTQEREYFPGDVIEKTAPGGGGTKLEKLFERVEERGDTPRAFVILTDLETSFPKEAPQYPIIWVSWGKDKAPFGEVVKVNPGG